MNEQHISDEDIKKFVSTEAPLNGKEWDEFIELAAEVNGHIRNCPNCLERVNKAQEVYDQTKREADIATPNAEKIARLDKDSEIQESELVPIKKKGFKEWSKGLVDKLMGKGEK